MNINTSTNNNNSYNQVREFELTNYLRGKPRHPSIQITCSPNRRPLCYRNITSTNCPIINPEGLDDVFAAIIAPLLSRSDLSRFGATCTYAYFMVSNTAGVWRQHWNEFRNTLPEPFHLSITREEFGSTLAKFIFFAPRIDTNVLAQMLLFAESFNKGFYFIKNDPPQDPIDLVLSQLSGAEIKKIGAMKKFIERAEDKSCTPLVILFLINWLRNNAISYRKLSQEMQTTQQLVISSLCRLLPNISNINLEFLFRNMADFIGPNLRSTPEYRFKSLRALAETGALDLRQVPSWLAPCAEAGSSPGPSPRKHNVIQFLKLLSEFIKTKAHGNRIAEVVIPFLADLECRKDALDCLISLARAGKLHDESLVNRIAEAVIPFLEVPLYDWMAADCLRFLAKTGKLQPAMVHRTAEVALQFLANLERQKIAFFCLKFLAKTDKLPLDIVNHITEELFLVIDNSMFRRKALGCLVFLAQTGTIHGATIVNRIAEIVFPDLANPRHQGQALDSLTSLAQTGTLYLDMANRIATAVVPLLANPSARSLTLFCLAFLAQSGTLRDGALVNHITKAVVPLIATTCRDTQTNAMWCLSLLAKITRFQPDLLEALYQMALMRLADPNPEIQKVASASLTFLNEAREIHPIQIDDGGAINMDL